MQVSFIGTNFMPKYGWNLSKVQLLGLDTDNGSEFINYALLDFCKTQEITFTRSRPYKKNDQAHVEEKNGSIVRRIIGYDRYEGMDAYNALSALYASLRLYVNFFQPSLKLISKKREGVKVTKKYDKAKTPYQRLLCSSHITEEVKTKLKAQYNDLDPVMLLKSLEKLQDIFWKHAWKQSIQGSKPEISIEINSLVVKQIDSIPNDVCIIGGDKVNGNGAETKFIKKATIVSDAKSADNQNQKVKNHIVDFQQEDNEELSKTDNKLRGNIRLYRRTNKPRKQLGLRTWRTRPDHFANEWSGIALQLELQPERTAKSLLEDLIQKKPNQFNISQVRTLHRRITEWRREQIKINQKQLYQNSITDNNEINKYASLVAYSVINR